MEQGKRFFPFRY